MVIATAYQFFQFCQDNLTVVSKEVQGQDTNYISKRQFIFTTSDAAFSRPETKTVPGTRLLRAVTNTGTPLIIRTRNLSWFCPGCRRGTDEYENAAYVQKWKGTSMKLTNAMKNFPSVPQDCILSHHSSNRNTHLCLASMNHNFTKFYRLQYFILFIYY